MNSHYKVQYYCDNCDSHFDWAIEKGERALHTIHCTNCECYGATKVASEDKSHSPTGWNPGDFYKAPEWIRDRYRRSFLSRIFGD